MPTTTPRPPAIDCQGNEVTILMLAPPAAAVPEQKTALTPGGKPTLKKRTKSERSDLYISHLASNVLATAKEAFAVAPGLWRCTIVAHPSHSSAGLALDCTEAVFCGSLTRQQLNQLQRSQLNLTRILDEVPQGLICRRGRTRELQPLDLSDEPELAAVLAEADRSLAVSPDE